MGIEQVQRKRRIKDVDDKKELINKLTDEILELRNSAEIVKHPNFVSWYKANVGNKLLENLALLKSSTTHDTMVRAQEAVRILEGLDDWKENINKQIDKNRKRIDILKKDIADD